MCVAELNVSVRPCRHRFYRLLRPCSPNTNLSNCPSKLAIQGWEIKCNFCPYCDGWNVSSDSYRLVGNDNAPSVGGLSRTPSLSTSLTSARRDSRRSSLASSSASAATSPSSYSGYSNGNTAMASTLGGGFGVMGPLTQVASEKNKAQNNRIESYLASLPQRIQQEQDKGRTTTSGCDDDGPVVVQPLSRAGTWGSLAGGPLSPTFEKMGDAVGRARKKGRRISRDFGFFR